MTDLNPRRVLVVDDEPAIRTLVSRVLRRAGFDPSEAIDGQDAIERLDAGPFDALVLDLMMPRVDGFGVVEHLIDTRPEMMERTIVLTAFPRTAVRERLHHLCNVVSKPFEMQELVDLVTHCASR
jgi:DNA-binding response OmpR family regulator